MDPTDFTQDGRNPQERISNLFDNVEPDTIETTLSGIDAIDPEQIRVFLLEDFVQEVNYSSDSVREGDEPQSNWQDYIAQLTLFNTDLTKVSTYDEKNRLVVNPPYLHLTDVIDPARVLGICHRDRLTVVLAELYDDYDTGVRNTEGLLNAYEKKYSGLFDWVFLEYSSRKSRYHLRDNEDITRALVQLKLLTVALEGSTVETK